MLKAPATLYSETKYYDSFSLYFNVRRYTEEAVGGSVGESSDPAAYRVLGTCRGHSSTVLTVDWSMDGRQGLTLVRFSAQPEPFLT